MKTVEAVEGARAAGPQMDYHTPAFYCDWMFGGEVYHKMVVMCLWKEKGWERMQPPSSVS